MKSTARPCNKGCGADIYFDDDKKSPRGISIPLDVDTDEPHQCPNPEAYTGRATLGYSKSLADRLTELESRVSRLEDSM